VSRLLRAAALVWWRHVAHFVSLHGLLHSQLLVEASHWVLALKLLQFDGRVLVQELVNREETTTDTDVNLVVVDTNIHLLGTELVDALLLTEEHDLQLGTLWVIVDVLCKLLVNRVSLHWNVDGNPRLKIDNVGLKLVNFTLGSLEISEQFK